MSLSDALAMNFSHASSSTKQKLAEKGYSGMFDTTAGSELVQKWAKNWSLKN